jgi:hypothetical protein
MVIGLITGADNRKVMASDGLRPCIIRDLDRGTLPHSQTGNKKPSNDKENLLSMPFFGRTLWKKCIGKYVFTRLASSEPSTKNGNASINILSESVTKSCILFGRVSISALLKYSITT